MKYAAPARVPVVRVGPAAGIGPGALNMCSAWRCIVKNFFLYFFLFKVKIGLILELGGWIKAEGGNVCMCV